MRTLSASSFLCCISTLIGVSALQSDEARGTLHTRRTFYVGGSYVHNGLNQISHGQMYVEQLTPANVTQEFPILFIHGMGMTGTNFLTTPDGRPGWADYFLSQGYEVYLVDQPARARSPWQKDIDGPQTMFGAVAAERVFTATSKHNLWPQASLHTQWPGNGTVGDPVFDQFYKAMAPSLESNHESALLVNAAASALLDMIGPVILLTHSQAGQYGWPLADAYPSKVKAIVAIEPAGPPLVNAAFMGWGTNRRLYGLSEIPVSFSPSISSPDDLKFVEVSSSEYYTCYQQAPPARWMTNLVGLPVLVLTGEASYHAVYDTCTVQFLAEAGVDVKHVSLQDVGIRGNGHMMFMEKNSFQIVDQVINPWLQQTLKSSCSDFELCYPSLFDFSA